MRWNDVAPTLTTGCTDITRGRYAHPEQHRAITLREAARLQSFPDTYVFHGNAGQIATQIGNAVPPEMMRTIARSLRAAIRA
ncbi:Modification methylase AplI [compost metagenome]